MHVVSTGQGPRLVLVHGSAADHSTWSIQLASSLRDRFTLVAYDRGGGSVEDQAAELATLEPAMVAGSSFGAVVALEYVRTRPCRGAVLIEPPMAATDELPAAQRAFLGEFDWVQIPDCMITPPSLRLRASWSALA